MYMFLYQAPRHAKPTWGSRRLVQSTIRGDFNLNLLYGSIRKRYTIQGHGIHAFQSLLAKMDMIEEMYGHFIMIEDKNDAVWFKLNYDVVTRPGTKFVGAWTDLDADAIQDLQTRYQELSEQKRYASSGLSDFAYHISQITSSIKVNYLNKAGLDGSKYQDRAMDYVNSITALRADLAEKSSQLAAEMKGIQDQVRLYMSERKL